MGQQTDNAEMTATSIRVDTETRDRLNEVGRRGESFDAIINRVLDEWAELKKKE